VGCEDGGEGELLWWQTVEDARICHFIEYPRERMTSVEWPGVSHQIAPSDALDISQTVYYLVENDPPLADDFPSALKRNCFVGKPAANERHCRAV
jgi:hypothetical protein